MIIGIVIFIICLVVIGISYGVLWYRYKRISTPENKYFLVLYKKENRDTGQAIVRDIIEVEKMNGVEATSQSAFSASFNNGDCVYWFEDQVPYLAGFEGFEGELILMIDKDIGVRALDGLQLVNKLVKMCFFSTK